MQSNTWKELAEQQMGVTLGEMQTLGGGDFAQSFRTTVVEVTSSSALLENLAQLHAQPGNEWDHASANIKSDLQVGDVIFIKTHSNPPARHFTTEGLGLHWLGQTDTVRVPDVLGASDQLPYLALQWIETDRGQVNRAAGEAEFGRQLAALHQAPCAAFGRQDSRSTGSLGLPNKSCSTWSEFYATQRLIPLMTIAADRNALPLGALEKIEQLAARLDEFVPADTRPSRLHGDLWAGNRLIDFKGYSWVIDPASHGGHREFDLAMMRLFGGFDDRCHAAYQEAWPMDAGWQDRLPLHQLAPLIVHAIKFGAAYLQATQDALDHFLQ